MRFKPALLFVVLVCGAAAQEMRPPLLGFANANGRLVRLQGIAEAATVAEVPLNGASVAALSGRASLAIIREAVGGVLTLLRLRDGSILQTQLPVPEGEGREAVFARSGDSAAVFSPSNGTIEIVTSLLSRPMLVPDQPAPAPGELRRVRVSDSADRVLAIVVDAVRSTQDLWVWTQTAGWEPAGLTGEVVHAGFNPRSTGWTALLRVDNQLRLRHESGETVTLAGSMGGKQTVLDFDLDGAGHTWVLISDGSVRLFAMNGNLISEHRCLQASAFAPVDQWTRVVVSNVGANHCVLHSLPGSDDYRTFIMSGELQ